MACFQYADDARIAGLDAEGAKLAFAEPGVRPNYAPSWTFRIEHLHVWLRLDPERQAFEGRTTVRLSPLPGFDGTVRLDLDGPTVAGVTDADGVQLAWSLDDGALAVRAGAATTFTVRYSGHAPRAGLYFTGPSEATPDRPHMAWSQCQDEDAHFFMPCLDHPRIKHPWTIELEGPVGHTLLSNGRLVSSGERDGHAFTTWEQEGPMPAYLFTVVSGPLHVTTTAWRDVPVRYLVPVGEDEAVQRAFGRTPEMMEVFSAFTGVDYPWPRYDQVVVHDFVFGGMENTACTTMVDSLLVDERVGPHWDPDGLVCHELAHQWFGDLVTCQDWSQAWLNESWATFMETVWFEHRDGAAEAAWYAFEQARSYLDEDSHRYRRPIASYDFREPIDLFDRHLYEKGAVVLRTLRGELGETGFRAGVHRYLTTHAHGTVHGRDFQRAMEEATGRNLDGFVQQWILGAGHPVLKVKLGSEDGLVTIGVTQTQTGDATAEAFALRLGLELVGQDGTVRSVVLPVRERDRTWAVPFDGQVRTVRVDPGFGVLAEIALEAPVGWLTVLAEDACPVLATRAIEALARRNTPAAIAVVERTLTAHPMWAVRGEAARLLSSRGGPEARDVLLAALASETEPRVRAAIAKGLGAFRQAVVADALLDALAADGWTWRVGGELMEALGRTRDPRAPDAIRAHLQTPSAGDQLLLRALPALAHAEDPSVLHDLVAFATGPHGDRPTSGAARALGVLGDKVPDVRTRCREVLVGLLDTGGFRTLLGALAGLSTLKDPASMAKLEQVHASSPDGRVRRMAYEALVAVRKGRTGDAGLAALQQRIDALAEENRTLRSRLDRLERDV